MAVVSLGLFQASSAQAGIIFSTFGTSTPLYDSTQNDAFVVAGASSVFGASYGEGSSFTALTSSTVSEIDVAVSTYLSTSGGFTVQLWRSTSSSGSNSIGTLLGSYSGTATSTAQILSIATPNGPSLAAGQTYYLLMEPATASTSVLWYANNIGASGQIYESKNGVADYKTLTLTAFSLLSTSVVVPEPSSVALSLVGLGLIGSVGFASRTIRRSDAPRTR